MSKEKVSVDRSQWDKKYYDKNKERIRRRNREYYYLRGGKEKVNAYNKRVRLEVLEHYGGIPPACVCCGESHIEFLCIDHIKGGGHKHRKSLGSWTIYKWLRSHNYPMGFRVLCHNCNLARGFYGYCPHESKK